MFLTYFFGALCIAYAAFLLGMIYVERTIGLPDNPLTFKALKDIAAERKRQIARWGDEHWPIADSAMAEHYKSIAAELRKECDDRTMSGMLTWHEILIEEVAEAFAEEDMILQHEEFIQVAAVATSIAEYLDKKIIASHTPSVVEVGK